MECENIHEFLLKQENLVQCPFCDKQMEVIKSVETKCCARSNITADGYLVCKNCGQVHHYLTAEEFVDFYENRHRIRKKSVFHRKYHILNVMNDIAQKNNIQIGYHNRENI